MTLVELEWIATADQDLEPCKECRTSLRPKLTVDENDPALGPGGVTELVWYHSTTDPDWPAKTFDPSVEWDETAWERMRTHMGDDGIERYLSRQQTRALHVGSYEAAIHNMLRRIDHQSDHGKQFFLHEVGLRANSSVAEGWITDPGGAIGDVQLDNIFEPGIDVAAYVNAHEDPGSLSLALRRESIAWTSRIPIPMPPTAAAPPVVLDPELDLSRDTARAIYEDVATLLPSNLRWQFASAAEYLGGRSEDWVRYLNGLLELVLHPDLAITALQEAERRLVE